MLRVGIVCFFVVALQVSALPEYIENLDRHLSLVPEKYQHVVKEFQQKRELGKERDGAAYCGTNWQFINNDAVHTKVQSTLVPQSHTIIVGYQDCHGNINPEVPVVRPTSPRPPGGGRRTTTPRTSGPTTTGCMWTPVEKIETFLTTVFTTVTYMVPNSHNYCAPEDYKCCADHVLLNNDCIPASSVASLEFLIHLGLIPNPGKK